MHLFSHDEGKGIEDAVNAVEAVNEYFGRMVYTLDIYGQVDFEQAEWFDELKDNIPSCGHFDCHVSCYQ